MINEAPATHKPLLPPGRHAKPGIMRPHCLNLPLKQPAALDYACERVRRSPRVSDVHHSTVLKCHACGREETIVGNTISEYAKAFADAVQNGKWMLRPDSRVSYLWCGTCAEEYERSGLPREHFETRALVHRTLET